MRVLLTRPYTDSLATAKLLNEKNIETVIEPLFEIRELDAQFANLSIFRALIFTSRHSVTIFAQKNSERNIPVYCVGEQTAETAKEHGFNEVHSADGDEEALADLVIKQIERSTALLRLTGYDHADKLADKLRKSGFTVMTLQLYEAIEKDDLTPETVSLLKAQKIDSVLFYSPKTVSRFYTLMNKQGMVDTCRSLTAWCISENVGEAAKDLPFRTIRIAAKPTQKDLLELIFKEPKESKKMFSEEEMPPLPKFSVSKWLISGMTAWGLFLGAIGGLAVLLLIDFGPGKVTERVLPAPRKFDEKVIAVDNRVSALEQQTRKLNEQQQASQQQIATAAQATAKPDTQLAKIMLGVTQLKSAYDTDAPLSGAINTLKSTITNSAIVQSLDELQKRTSDNFPSKEKIISDLENLQYRTHQNLRNENGDQSLDWKARAKLALGQLVRVTPTRNVVADKNTDHVTQAVASGDFNLAQKLAQKLPQTPDTQAVISEIAIRNDAQNMIDKIVSQITSAIGQSGGLY